MQYVNNKSMEMDVGVRRFEIMVKFTDLLLIVVKMDKLILYAHFIARWFQMHRWKKKLFDFTSKCCNSNVGERISMDILSRKCVCSSM